MYSDESSFGIKAALVTPQKKAPSSAQLGVRSDQNILTLNYSYYNLTEICNMLNFVNLQKKKRIKIE